MSVADPAPAPDPDLVVIGHQWWWEVRYPKSGVVNANEIGWLANSQAQEWRSGA
jgi:cytochrome c oxidase subunit 2